MKNTLIASLLVAFVTLMGSQQALATGYKYNTYKASTSKSSYGNNNYTKYTKYTKYKKYNWVKPQPVSAC